MKTVSVFLSALLYAASLTKPALWWLSFLSLVPLFIVLEQTRPLLKKAGFMMLWAVAHTAVMGYWLVIALVANYGSSVPMAALFMILFVFFPVCLLYLPFGAAFHFFHRNTLGFYGCLVPSLWVFLDFAKSRVPVLIPWGDIGYAAVSFLPYVQVADLVGVYGVSFLIVMVNGFCAYLFGSVRFPASGEHRGLGLRLERKAASGTAMCLVIMAVLVPMVYGVYRISEMDGIILKASGLQGINATVVQGNFRLADRWNGMGFSHRLKTYLEMSRKATGYGGPSVTVWPETVLNASDHQDDRFFVQMMQWIGSESLLISGGVHTEAPDGPIPGAVYNSAYLISGQGQLMRYDKQILLPYAEAVPPVDLLGRYYTAPEHFSCGRTPSRLQTPLGSAGISICLEILYPGFIRNAANQGAEFLVNLSNDAWFGRTAMPHLHLNAARMRAVENRRYLLRAANSGISAVIGPDGRVIANTDLFERQCITGRFLLLQQATVFSIFGEWVVFLAAGIIGAAALIRVIRVTVLNAPGAAG